MATIPAILAPVDGSEQSMNTIAYLSRMLSSKNVAIELFHVLAEAPEAFFDQGANQEATAFESQIGKWKSSRSSRIDRFMQAAEETLLFNGFPPGSILTTIEPRQEGIARDIISKSQNGYAAVAIGRRGFGELPEFMLGSIAAKLTDTIDHVPLAIIGGQPDTRKAIVAFDRSRGIRKGLAKAGNLLSPEFEEFTMGRVTRKILYLAYNKAIWIV